MMYCTASIEPRVICQFITAVAAQYCYDYVLDLVYEYRPRLLTLLQFHAFHLYAEEVGLHILPFPAAAALAVLQLYLLHRRYELVGIILVTGLLLEQFVVQHLAPVQKSGYPHAVHYAAKYKYCKYQTVVHQQYHPENYKTQQGEQHPPAPGR